MGNTSKENYPPPKVVEYLPIVEKASDEVYYSRIPGCHLNIQMLQQDLLTGRKKKN
jgi:hypothetical protein